MVAPAGSHTIYIGEVAKLFANRNHNVTFLLPSNQKVSADLKNSNFNILHFQTSQANPHTIKEHMDTWKEMAFNPSLMNQLKHITLLKEILPKQGLDLLKDEEMMTKLALLKFDYVIVDSLVLSYLLVPYKLGIDYATLRVDCSMGRRIPLMASYNPLLMTSFSDDMTFWQRLINRGLQTVISWTDIGGLDASRELVPDMPEKGYSELLMKASLCLQLRDNVMDFIRPEMPDVIPIGSVMARPAKPLPEDMQKFMDDSTKGVIWVSFGSLVGDLPPSVIDKFMKAFALIPQTILFSFKYQLNDIPNNVKVLPWAPQNDLLAHPNMKLFISHCGMNSLIESVYHGVPVLAVPYAIDQHNNAALVRAKGLGKSIKLHDFSAEELVQSVADIVNDKFYQNNSKKLSAVFKHVKQAGLRDPVSWVEHVIQFGGDHLRSHAYNMPDYQYFMYDIYCFLLSALICLVLTVRCLITFCCKKKSVGIKTKGQ